MMKYYKNMACGWLCVALWWAAGAGMAGCGGDPGMNGDGPGGPPLGSDEPNGPGRLDPDEVLDDELARLWISSPNFGVFSFANPGFLDGAVVGTSTALRLGASSGVFDPSDMAVSATWALFIANGNGIAIYEDGRLATGPRPVDRTVSGPNSEINSARALAIDAENDVLFVVDRAPRHAIYVFDRVSDPDFDGDVPPARVIASSDTLFNPEQMFFSGGDLYVVNRTDILVFANASTLDTLDARPDRVISSPLLEEPIISIDSADRLVVANRSDTVYVWNDASTLDGNPPPDLVLTIEGADRVEAAVIDSYDRLFAADRNAHAIYSYDHVSLLESGLLLPERIIESPDVRTPDRLILVEQPEWSLRD